MEASLPGDLPENFTYKVISDGQFRVKEIRDEEAAVVSNCNLWPRGVMYELAQNNA